MIQPDVKQVTDAARILGLVFSRDRAMQLDACLRSFERQLSDVALPRLVVLYRASTPLHEGQYVELASTFSGKATFVAERAFRQQVLSLLKAADGSRVRPGGSFLPGASPEGREDDPGSRAGQDHLLFLVDDTLFVRAFNLASMRRALLNHADALGLSLRLGENTTLSYVQDAAQPLPDFRSAGEGLLAFDWTKAAGDFGYPLEVSSSLYRLADMRSILQTSTFDDPNSLESKLSLQSRRFRRSQPLLLCPTISVAFSAPLNRVQTVFENRSGKDPALSQESLADRFEHGERMDLSILEGFVPRSCHQEIEMKFTARREPDGRR